MQYYHKNLDDAAELSIVLSNGNYVADMTMIDQPNSGPVTLANEEEASKLIAEFEDGDTLCHEEGSIMGKYEAFHPFRP